MQKDDSVVVPTDPSFAQLVTGVGEINANKIKFTFPTTSFKGIQNLTAYGSYDTKYNYGGWYRYNRINKSIYLAKSAGQSYVRYDIALDTWSNVSLYSTYGNGFDVGKDGNLYCYTGYPTVYITKYDINTDTQTNIATVDENQAYENGKDCLHYASGYSNFLGYEYFQNSNSKRSVKIDFVTKTVTQVTAWGYNPSGSATLSNAFCASYSNMTCLLWGTTRASVHAQGIQYRNESTDAITSFSPGNDYTVVNEYSGFNAGFGNMIYQRATSDYQANSMMVYDAIFQCFRTFPYNFSQAVTSNGACGVCYDTDEHELYLARYDGSVRYWGKVKTDFNDMSGATAGEFDFFIDLSVLLRIGLKVYLTVTTPNCYMKTENGNYRTIITNQRIEIKNALKLKASNFSIQGLLEISQ